MPLRFRCGYCDRLLGIARRKAGMETTCPHCGYTLTVPEEDLADHQSDIEDLDELLNPMEKQQPSSNSTEHSTHRSHLAITAANLKALSKQTASCRQNSQSQGSEAAKSAGSYPAGEQEILIKDLDEVLLPADGTLAKDTVSLSNQTGQIVLSVQRATALAIVAVVLIALAFAAGYLLGTTK
jgi:hypothetical protein